MNSFVALGDSFTAGNGCDPERRWADLLAAQLAEGRPGFRYVNLGVDGADSRAVLETIPVAVAHRPDLVTLICGANDVLLTTRPDLDAFRRRFDAMLRRLASSLPGTLVVTSTYPEGWAIPGTGRRTRRRIREGMGELNRAILEIAGRWSVLCLDVTDHPGIGEAANFDADGLHPSALGHRRAALEFRSAITRGNGKPNPKWSLA